MPGRSQVQPGEPVSSTRFQREAWRTPTPSRSGDRIAGRTGPVARELNQGHSAMAYAAGVRIARGHMATPKTCSRRRWPRAVRGADGLRGDSTFRTWSLEKPIRVESRWRRQGPERLAVQEAESMVVVRIESCLDLQRAHRQSPDGDRYVPCCMHRGHTPRGNRRLFDIEPGPRQSELSCAPQPLAPLGWDSSAEGLHMADELMTSDVSPVVRFSAARNRAPARSQVVSSRLFVAMVPAPHRAQPSRSVARARGWACSPFIPGRAWEQPVTRPSTSSESCQFAFLPGRGRSRLTCEEACAVDQDAVGDGLRRAGR